MQLGRALGLVPSTHAKNGETTSQLTSLGKAGRPAIGQRPQRYIGPVFGNHAPQVTIRGDALESPDFRAAPRGQ